LITKIAHSHTSSEIIWHKSLWANNLDALCLSGVVIKSPNALDAFSTELLECFAKWISIDTFKKCIDELFISACCFNGSAYSSDCFFEWVLARCAGSSISNPFFAFVINFITCEGGFVEECSAGAGERGSGAGSIGKSESSGALGAFGEFIESVTSEGIGETLAVSFVLTSRAVLFDTSSIGKGVSSVALSADIEDCAIENTGEPGEVSLEGTAPENAKDIGVFGEEGTGEDLGEVVEFKSVCKWWIVVNSCCYFWIETDPRGTSWGWESPCDGSSSSSSHIKSRC
jgi:hypothetical protein